MPDKAPLIVRLVLRRRPSTDIMHQARLLHRVFSERWPRGVRAHFVVTPGGFFKLPFPKTWDGRSGWNSTDEDIKPIIRYAKDCLETKIVRACQLARGKAGAVTVGIDIGEAGPVPHAELVAVVDPRKGKIVAWTGKSYPVEFQQHGLVHVTNLVTHLVTVARERVLVLGCHDLNMFSPRGRTNQRAGSERHHRCAQMVSLARRFKPTVVLQHPHQTDTARIWAQGWSGIRGHSDKVRFPEGKAIRAWASGIAHFKDWEHPRGTLESVLRSTRGYDRRDLDIVLSAQD